MAEVVVVVAGVVAEVDPRTKCHSSTPTLYELHLDCVRSSSTLWLWYLMVTCSKVEAVGRLNQKFSVQNSDNLPSLNKFHVNAVIMTCSNGDNRVY